MKEKLYGVINKVVYYNKDSGFGVISLKMNFSSKDMAKYKDILYSNILSVTCLFDRQPIQDEKYTFIGEFVESKYGIQLKAESFIRKKQNTLESVVVYLSSDLFPGIGKVTAANVYNALGEDCLDKIKNDKSVLDSVNGLNETQKNTIYDGICLNSSKEEMVLELTEMGLSLSMVNRIISSLHDKAASIIRNNPYDLIDRVEGIGFIKADKIAKGLGIKDDDPIRLKAITKYYLNKYTYETGDSYIEKSVLVENILMELNKEEEIISKDKYLEVLESLVLNGDVYIDDEDNIYDMSIYYSENMVASKLSELLKNDVCEIDENRLNKIINKLEEDNDIIYNEKQKEAIISAVKENVVIITGGPGTGKSTVINGIVNALELYYENDMIREDIALLAPTGRASKRLNEVTKHSAQTIHKFLGYQGKNSFMHGPENIVSNKIIIIDEMSMVDILLASRLLSSIASDSKVIMVGDSDQLPSVAPGDVLCNLIDSKEIKTIRLDQIHRQAESSTIVQLANCINSGTLPENLLERQKDRNFVKLNDNIVINNIITIIRQAINKGMNLLKEIQVLVPMYKGELGIDAINNQIQQIFNPFVDYELSYMGKKFRVNDKVIQLVNRSDKGVMNGDIGYVISLDIDKDEVIGLTVLYDFGPVDYEKEEIDDLNLAYAISIHKSQGSEFKTVIIPFTMKYFIMLKKKLLYTAITRAKEYLIMLGSTEAIKLCTTRVEQKRKTRLLEKIKQQFDEKVLTPYDFM